MSVAPLDFALTRSGLAPLEKLVLVALCRKVMIGTKKHSCVFTAAKLSELLEITEINLDKQLKRLQKKQLIQLEKKKQKNGIKYSVDIFIVLPAQEDYAQKQNDSKTQLVLDMFNKLFDLYPAATSRTECWQTFKLLKLSQDSFLDMLDDVEERIANDWNGRPAPRLITYLTRRLRNEPLPREDNLPSVIDRNLVPTAQTRGSRMTPGWVLSRSLGEWAMDNCGLTREQVLFEADDFKDYWLSRADKVAIKLDWDATWRNWIRRNSKKHTKTFVQQAKEYKEEAGKEKFSVLANADNDYLKQWGFGDDSKS